MLAIPSVKLTSLKNRVKLRAIMSACESPMGHRALQNLLVVFLQELIDRLLADIGIPIGRKVRRRRRMSRRTRRTDGFPGSQCVCAAAGGASRWTGRVWWAWRAWRWSGWMGAAEGAWGMVRFKK